MWLVTDDKSDTRILLAKYYPDTGWYMFHTEEELNKWFEENFDCYFGCPQGNMKGRTDLKLEFEDDNKS